MEIVNCLLPPDEYYNEVTPKNTIYLHHTAGGHRPDFSINGWDKDKLPDGRVLHVATSYVIGGLSTTDKNDVNYDGKIYKAFDDKFWAHHLGTSYQNNTKLNKQSVGLEICNYGPLKQGKDGLLYNYVNKPVPADMSVVYTDPFKGYKVHHKYTEKQLNATKALILDIANRHNIDVRAGLQYAIKLQGVKKAFDLQVDAQIGRPGLWTHVNVLGTKFDCHPQPELVEMILSL
jgi:hypothetical protein